MSNGPGGITVLEEFRSGRGNRGIVGKRSSLEVDAVYDIETERDWGGFLVGGMLRADGHYIEHKWDTERQFANTIANTNGKVWAHAGGSFDHKWFLETVRDDGTCVDLQAAGSRLVRIRRGGLELLDSNALTKISLRDFTKGLDVEKSNHGLACLTPGVCGDGCGGFCRFHRAMPRQEFEAVREYLRADCESLLGALRRLQVWGDEHDLDLGATVGSSSWACAQRWLDLPEAELSLDDHLFAREGYYGGRVQIFRSEASEGRSYDINASYPYALSVLELPWGSPRRRSRDYAIRDFEAGREGFVRARVHVPEMWIPPLPVRLPERIAYPTGDIEGVWTCSELRNAMALGVSVYTVTEGLFWPDTKRVFKQWIDTLWELRRGASGGKSGPLGTFLKFYMNSLTGKLGMKPVSKRYILNPTSLTPYMEELGCGIWSYDGPTVRRKKSSDKWIAGDACCHVEWAAYITAMGRMRWLKQAMAGDDDMVMGDTDSVFCLGERSDDIGTDLGKWQYDGRFKDFTAIAPKFYRYVPTTEAGNPRDVSRPFVLKSKGVGRGESASFGELFDTGRAVFRAAGMAGFRWATRRGNLFVRNETRRTVSRGYGDRIFDSRTGVTNPPRAEDLVR